MEVQGQEEESLKSWKNTRMDTADKDMQPVPAVKSKYRLELEAPLVPSYDDEVYTKAEAARADTNRTVQDEFSYHWIRIIKSLVKLRFNMNKVDFDGLTPLDIAVSYGNVSHVKSVIRAGADVNRADLSGSTALMGVVLFGSIEEIDKMNLLLQEGS